MIVVKIVYFLIVILLAGAIGTATGLLSSMFVDSSSLAYKFLSTSITPAFLMRDIDLMILSMDLGVRLHINILTLVGMTAAALFCLKKL